MPRKVPGNDFLAKEQSNASDSNGLKRELSEGRKLRTEREQTDE